MLSTRHFECSACALVVASQAGRIKYADAYARAWLRKFFPLDAARNGLPVEVRRWLAARKLRGGKKTLVVKDGGSVLTVRRHSPHPRDSVALLLSVTGRPPAHDNRKQGPLTAREAEVLYWISVGKSDEQIAQILGIAACTVGKHLEHIYPKLGVENRTAAANVAQSGAVESMRAD